MKWGKNRDKTYEKREERFYFEFGNEEVVTASRVTIDDSVSWQIHDINCGLWIPVLKILLESIYDDGNLVIKERNE